MGQSFYIHSIDPIAFKFLDYPVHWYWLCYFMGYFIVTYGGEYLIREGCVDYDLREFQKSCLLIWLGLFIGSRLFYVLIYNLDYFINRPVEILSFWNGGMSFHGAILGMLITGYLSVGLSLKKFFVLSNIIAFLSPLGLFFGRIGNFVNGELAGRVTDVPWAVIFPRLYDNLPRHPSQLYEAVLEGPVCFLVLYFFKKDLHIPGRILAIFFMFYSSARFIIEFLREPDSQLGYYFTYFSMGQILCFLMFLLGLYVYRYSLKSSG